MHALHLLKQDHRTVDGLFAQVMGTFARPAHEESAVAAREGLFTQLVHELTTHTRIEEEIFYPALRDRPETADLIAGSYRDHNQVKDLISQLGELPLGSPEFRLRLDELQRQVQRHMEEEEGRLFPRAERVLDAAQLDDLGGRMEQARKGAVAWSPGREGSTAQAVNTSRSAAPAQHARHH